MNVLRDLSVLLLAVEAFLFALIPLALFGALVYGVWRLRQHKNLPTWLSKARNHLTLGLSYVESAMGVLVKPVFAVHSAFATFEGWTRAMRERRR